jgi:deoxyribodipyrimidine photo-lyase
MKRAIVWHLRDLRIDWNPAVSAATHSHDLILPLYIYHADCERLGGASQWWLKKSLEELNQNYKAKGTSLHLQTGDPCKILPKLAKEHAIDSVFWNICFEPQWFEIQTKLEKILKEMGIEVVIFNGGHLIDPREIEVEPGKPYKVFTPFYKATLKELQIPEKPPTGRKIAGIPGIKSTPLPIELAPWMQKLEKYWSPGREGGLKQLKRLPLSDYKNSRDFPAVEGTSKLSPYLHFGEICPHEAWIKAQDDEPFTRQLIWREFATYFLFYFPEARNKNWNTKFDRFPWKSSPAALEKWKHGKTGYPIVDAAMRQLWEEGWMHNRLRMIVASFLTKDLLLHWKEGEKWFWDTLVDADEANNTLGWQWTAGSGPDAAPYFRIFNPVLQGEKFDPEGEFVRSYVPELKKLPTKWIHHPWDAPEEILNASEVILGKTYPKPLVDHSKARKEALASFKKIK